MFQRENQKTWDFPVITKEGSPGSQWTITIVVQEISAIIKNADDRGAGNNIQQILSLVKEIVQW